MRKLLDRERILAALLALPAIAARRAAVGKHVRTLIAWQLNVLVHESYIQGDSPALTRKKLKAITNTARKLAEQLDSTQFMFALALEAVSDAKQPLGLLRSVDDFLSHVEAADRWLRARPKGRRQANEAIDGFARAAADIYEDLTGAKIGRGGEGSSTKHLRRFSRFLNELLAGFSIEKLTKKGWVSPDPDTLARKIYEERRTRMRV